MKRNVGGTNRCSEGHGARDEGTGLGVSGGHHGKLCLVGEVDEGLDLFLDRDVIVLVGGLVGISGLTAGGSIAERHVGGDLGIGY